MMKYFGTFLLLVCMSTLASGQTTYTWSGGASGNWNTAGNWTPTRTSPATNDIIVFNTSTVVTLDYTSPQTIGQLQITGNANVVFTQSAVHTLIIGAGLTGSDLTIDAGSALVDSASTVVTMNVATGNTGSISGTFRARALSGGASASHLLTAADASGITFQGGSVCVQDTGCTGNICGTSSAVANSVVFASGSQFIQYAGSNPFARSQPSTVVVFNHGGWYRYDIPGGTPAFSGRTYPNLEYNPVTGNAASTSGGSVLTIDTLKVTTDTLKIGMTATPGHSIKGDISIASGAVLYFIPATPGTMNLNGTSPQVISNSGVLTFSKNQTLVLNNSNGFTLNGDATFDGTLNFTAGKLTVATGTFALDTAVVTGAGSGKFIDGKVSRLIARAGAFGWPAGQSADYLPDSVYTSSVTTGGLLTLQTLDKTATPLAGIVYGNTQILKRYVHSSGDNNLNFAPDSVGISYASADLPVGVYASNLQVVRWNGGPWLNMAVSRIDSTNNIIYVKSNLGGGDYVVTGQAGFLFSSKSVINYGTVPAGQTKMDSVIITNSGNTTLSIDSVKSTLGDFSVNPTTLSLPAGNSSKFYITYAPATAGVKNATIVFYHGGINGRDTVTVSGGATLSANFAASPDSLDFGTQIRNSSNIDTIVIANAGNISLQIDSVRSPDPSFTILPASVVIIPASGNAKFFVTYKPLNAGAKSAKIVFYSNSTTQPDTVYAKGDVVIAPIFSPSKSVINFSAVLLGSQKTDSLTVTNAGTSSLNITSITSTDAAFTVSPTSAVIAVDTFQKFYVTFSATSNGTKAASIVATSNVMEIRDTVKVSGIGSTVVTIAEARKDLNNDYVADHSVTHDTLVISGVITSPNMGLSASQMSYFMQDATGGLDLWVYGLSTLEFARGDSVMVIGTVAQYKGVVEFTPLAWDNTYIKLLSHVSVPAPKRVTLHQFFTNPESYEGQLIEIDTVYKTKGTWPTTPANVSLYVTDGIKLDTLQLFIDFDSNIGGTEPAYPINVVGIMSQYSSSTPPNNGYEISPRDSADIVHTPGTAGVDNQFSGVPKNFELFNSYPNPFNPSTTISYGLPQQSKVTLRVYSVLGQEIATLVDDVQGASYHKIQWNGKDNNGTQVSSGVYFFRIVAQPVDGKSQTFTQVRKMMLMK
jgi:hypothetical protein